MNNAKKTNVDQSTRFTNLKAMERLMIAMGGKEGLMAWMAAMPEDVTISPLGGVSNESLMAVAASEDSYNAAVRAFAVHMAPMLTAIAGEV